MKSQSEKHFGKCRQCGIKTCMTCPCFGLFRKITSFWQNIFFTKKWPMVLGRTVSCIQFLVVSDFEALFKLCKRSGYSESLWIAFKWGLNLRVFNTAIYGKINLHEIKTQDTFFPHHYFPVAMIGIICLHMHFVLYTLNMRSIFFKYLHYFR